MNEKYKSFLTINVEKKTPRGKDPYYEVSPDFNIDCDDYMKKGGKFYAIYDDKTGLWMRNEQKVYDIVDNKIFEYADRFKRDLLDKGDNTKVRGCLFKRYNSGVLTHYASWVRNSSPNLNYRSLDEELTYLSDKVDLKKYRSKRLSYDLKKGDISCYDELISTLYSEEDRTKLEWSIGSIFAGWKETKKNDRMVLLYGRPGSGKSTVIDILKMLFEDYCGEVEVDDIVNNTRQFAKASLRDNPLVAIQDDAKLTRIDNQEMNKILSHTKIEINEKGMQQYYITSRAIYFVATNEIVDLSDSRKGMNRRIFDIYPTGEKISPRTHYFELMKGIKFELGAIAEHCLQVYLELGSENYNNYKPIEMQNKTNVVKNFCFDKLPELKENDPISRGMLYKWYRAYCEDEGIHYVCTSLQLEEQLLAYGYYKHHDRMKRLDGKVYRNALWGLDEEKILDSNNITATDDNDIVDWLNLDYNKSIFDVMCKDYPAQMANADGNPSYPWDKVHTKLKDLNTSKLHWVKFPEEHKNHIIVDLDLVNEKGEKDLNENIKAARNFPPTYAELSRSGGGVHLHYIYNGDVSKLNPVYAPGIEIKVYDGKKALRRLVTKCNTFQIAEISSGLPLIERKVKEMISDKAISDEKHLRNVIEKALRKGYPDIPSTTQNINFIEHILEEAFDSGMCYDVNDLEPSIYDFAANGSNKEKRDGNKKKVLGMKFASSGISAMSDVAKLDKNKFVFFDVEVFPNVFIVCFKERGNDVVTRWINPSAMDIKELCDHGNLGGFNNLIYDNPILLGRMMGKNNYELYELSKRIIGRIKDPGLKNAKNLSAFDVYDFSSKKQSLKKFEIELGLTHIENSYDWDKDLPEDKWDEVADYCANDVIATEAVFEDRYADFVAREMLAKLSGMYSKEPGTINDPTNSLTAKLIFGDDKNPQSEFVYPDLSKEFPGYAYDPKKHESTFMGEVLGEGGYVWADPGAYWNVDTEDVASEHPHSIIAMNLFGDKYTARFKMLVDARIAIKHGDIDTLKSLFDGKLVEFVDFTDKAMLKALSQALKIAINSVYGLTAAHFANPFKDDRNIDNVVAKRGALFMCQLKNKVIAAGGHPIHCKTDSIKLVNPTEDILNLVREEGRKYGYTFETEAEYEKICLINKAVYVAREKQEHWDEELKKTNGWTATGTQFIEPVVFKTLFSNEEITVDDLSQTKAVSGEGKIFLNIDSDETDTAVENMKFVGKVGGFVPVNKYGGALVRVTPDKRSYVSGTKGYRWMETEDYKILNEDIINHDYYDSMILKAKNAIQEFVDYDYFVSDAAPVNNMIPFEAVGDKEPVPFE